MMLSPSIVTYDPSLTMRIEIGMRCIPEMYRVKLLKAPIIQHQGLVKHER